jgi:mRNA-degrading endonuclease RelE of RelBE toxin-antitoxin system
MKPKHRFAITYDPEVKLHLKFIERRYYSLIRTTIESQLQFEPEVETKNHKPLTRSVEFEAEWELRFGPDNRFRVFYQTDMEHSEVLVLAIGVKKGNRLWIGEKEVKL